jgi:predicted DNA-binding transcriptional regulator YafY
LDYLKFVWLSLFDYEKDILCAKAYELPEPKHTEGEPRGASLNHLRHAYHGELEAVAQRAMEALGSQLTGNGFDTTSLDQILQVRLTMPRRTSGLEDLHKAIANNESVIIKYFSGQKATVVDKPCDPYHLLNYKDNWYLVAFCHEKQDYRDFLCSRILSVENTNTTFIPDPEFNIEKHKRDSQLFAADAPPLQIVAEFDKYSAHWIRLKPIHPSQQVIERADGSLEISFKVASMENIIRWVLSFGEHARIIAPLELQERVKRTISRMNYLCNRV